MPVEHVGTDAHDQQQRVTGGAEAPTPAHRDNEASGAEASMMG
jgi:hypothetical protein